MWYIGMSGITLETLSEDNLMPHSVRQIERSITHG